MTNAKATDPRLEIALASVRHALSLLRDSAESGKSGNDAHADKLRGWAEDELAETLALLSHHTTSETV